MTLGQLLKSRRMELGRSLEQVAASTKIHLKILTAIENDQYADLPARTFTRGFIVNYAKALKLDPDQLLKDYHEFLEQKFNDRPSRDQGHQGYAFEGKELEQKKRWMVIGASIAAIFAISVLLVFKPQNHKHKEKHKEFEEESADVSQTIDDAENTSPTLKTSPSPLNLATSPAVISSSSPSVKITTSPTSAPLVITESTAVASSTTTSTSALITAAPIAIATPSSTPAPIIVATPAPTIVPVVVATATPVLVIAPTPSPTPVATSTPKPDKLNKGDNLEPSDVKRKITFKAKEDVWVRYQSDNRPVGIIILRKDRLLVIKAKDSIVFETNHPESLQYKIKTANYGALSSSKGEVTPEATVKENTEKNLGTNPLPDEVPAPAEGH